MKARTSVIGRVFNGSAPGANADIFATALTPGEDGSAFRVTVALTTASVFNVTVSNGTTKTLGLNSSTALSASDLFTFTFAAPKVDQSGTALEYNFQVETDGTIPLLVVEEVIGAVL